MAIGKLHFIFYKIILIRAKILYYDFYKSLIINVLYN
jgi:hypothetical protein